MWHINVELQKVYSIISNILACSCRVCIALLPLLVLLSLENLIGTKTLMIFMLRER